MLSYRRSSRYSYNSIGDNSVDVLLAKPNYLVMGTSEAMVDTSSLSCTRGLARAEIVYIRFGSSA